MLAAALTAVITMLVAAPPLAHAWNWGAAITSPGSEALVNPGYRGPVVVDLTDAASGSYRLDVAAEKGGYFQSFTYDYDPSTSEKTWRVPIPPTFYEGLHYIDLYNDMGESIDGRSFRVKAYAAKITAPTTSTHGAGSSVTAKVRWENIPGRATVHTVIYDETRGTINRRCTWSGPAYGATTSCVTDPLRVGSYAVRAVMIHPLTAAPVRLDTAALAVEAPLAVTKVSATPSTFYPLVQDGYRDSTTLTWRTSAASTNVVKVRNRSGVVVRSLELGRQAGGWHSWRWGGRNDAGAKVPRGAYTLRLIAVRQPTRHRIDRTVTVAPGP